MEDILVFYHTYEIINDVKTCEYLLKIIII